MIVFGATEVRGRIAEIQRKFPGLVGEALYEENEEVLLPMMKMRTPIRTGNLYMSGRVERPTVSRGLIQSLITFGGEQAPYAPAVHENLFVYHRVGQAKFVESVYNEQEKDIPERLAVRIADKLQQWV